MPATPTPSTPSRWDLFCRVIDNHGDLGVCWRLAADLAHRGVQVRLWIDDARALTWMAPQGQAGVQVMPWRDPLADELPGDVVVEAFGCDPPAAFVARMAAAVVPPVWINLEYLSAEGFVERSHGLRSPQWSGPGTGLDKWFFYPGFTPRTGGLIRERHLGLPVDEAPGSPRPSAAELLQAHGLLLPPDRDIERTVLLFGYRQPALPGLLEALAGGHGPGRTRLLVTPGWSAEAVGDWLGAPMRPGAPAVARGRLQLIPLPALPQTAFDRLLAACDLNLVRGEDSLVRALWAARPMLWQLYPQEDTIRLTKLQAFLDVHLDDAAPPGLRAAFEAWNGARTWTAGDWSTLLEAALPPVSTRRTAGWTDWSAARARQLAQGRPDLTSALLDFARQHRSRTG
ncbi:putative repeat protein (TIGR03837 family) [Sphaerotilus hippei]|uniref:Protein-arginine rhamnosyltransferase n=1 Tax=Sphaerotilus hippei TaxID=744406 RepID=A0A318GYZ8_9BURK|nr:elongation factor P maturation arginine rhamnosyltransferase EarP [Sphaerotilus hippei]PXW95253.1 putative repeat protein (TIGR03837 family) [Sphaerotilus hippei]